MNEKGRWNGLPLVIFGSGGISREVALIISEINLVSKNLVFDLLGFVENTSEKIGSVVDGIEVITSDLEFEEFSEKFPVLGVVLPLGSTQLKKKIFTSVLKGVGNLVFPNVIHPSSRLDSSRNRIGLGNVITANNMLTLNIEMGNFNLLNDGVSVGHDTKIGDFCVIGPQSSIAGNVVLGDEVLIGTGARVLQNCSVANKVVVGSGSVVLKSIDEEGVTIMGVPGIKYRGL